MKSRDCLKKRVKKRRSNCVMTLANALVVRTALFTSSVDDQFAHR